MVSKPCPAVADGLHISHPPSSLFPQFPQFPLGAFSSTITGPICRPFPTTQAPLPGGCTQVAQQHLSSVEAQGVVNPGPSEETSRTALGFAPGQYCLARSWASLSKPRLRAGPEHRWQTDTQARVYGTDVPNSLGFIHPFTPTLNLRRILPECSESAAKRWGYVRVTTGHKALLPVHFHDGKSQGTVAATRFLRPQVRTLSVPRRRRRVQCQALPLRALDLSPPSVQGLFGSWHYNAATCRGRGAHRKGLFSSPSLRSQRPTAATSRG